MSSIITLPRETVQQALEALEEYAPQHGHPDDLMAVLFAFRAALAQPAGLRESRAFTKEWCLRMARLEMHASAEFDIGPARARQDEPVARSLTEDERAAIEYFALNPSMAVLALSHWLRRDKSALAQQAESVQEPAFHGFMSDDGTQVDVCFSPSAPRKDGTYATAYYTAPPERDALLQALQTLMHVCQRMDLEHQAQRPSEAEYQAAMQAAQAAIQAVEGAA